VFLYTSSIASQTFVLLGKGAYTTNCPTQIRFLTVNSSTYLITGATDGHLALWCLDHVLDGVLNPGTMSIKSEFDTETITAETISWQTHHPIHSSSIKSLETIKITNDCVLFVGGGDDNALSISLMRWDSITDTHSPSIRTVSIPDAHASSITAIKTLKYKPATQDGTTPTEIEIASSGNDHRVKIWLISIDPDKEGVDAVRIVQRLDRYSPVADISSMDVLHRVPSDEDDGSGTEHGTTDSKDTGLLVCGVGMEMSRLRLD
jgi:hypothetical protein